MHKIFDFIDFNNWILFSNILNFRSCATSFNMDQLCNRFECSKTLYSDVNEICIRIKFIFDSKYITSARMDSSKLYQVEEMEMKLLTNYVMFYKKLSEMIMYKI